MSARNLFVHSATRSRRSWYLIALVALATSIGIFFWWRRVQQGTRRQTENAQREVTNLKKLVADTQDEAHREQRLKYLRRLLELQPQNVEALKALAKELYSDSDDDEALPIIERLIKQKPDFITAYFWRGVVRSSGNPMPQQLKQAEADLKKVLQAQPDDPNAHRYLARVYMRLDKPQQAIKEFEAVGRGRPYASAHWLELANAYRKAGDSQKAEAWRQRFVALKEENSQLKDVWDRLALTPEDFDSNLRMATLLLHSLDSSEDNYQLYQFHYAKQPDAGVEYYVRKAVQLRPDDARARAIARQLEQAYLQHLKAARQAQKSGDLEQAKWHLDHAYLLRPDDIRTQQALYHLAPVATRSPVAP